MGNRVGRHSGHALLSLVLAVNVLFAPGLVQALHTCTEFTSPAPLTSSDSTDQGRAGFTELVDQVEADCIACYLASHARGLTPPPICPSIQSIDSSWPLILDPPAPVPELPAVSWPRAPPLS